VTRSEDANRGGRRGIVPAATFQRTGEKSHPFDYARRSGYRLTVGHFGFGLPGKPCARCQTPRSGAGLTWTFMHAHKEQKVWLHLRTVPLCPCCAFQQAAADAVHLGVPVPGAPQACPSAYSAIEDRHAWHRHPCTRCGKPIRPLQRVAAFAFWCLSKRPTGPEPAHQEVTMCMPCARREARAQLAFVRRKARILHHPMPCAGCTARVFARQNEGILPIPEPWRPLMEALNGLACVAPGPGGPALYAACMTTPDAWQRLCRAGICPSGPVRHGVGACAAPEVAWMRIAIHDGRVAVNLSVPRRYGSSSTLRRQAQDSLRDWVKDHPWSMGEMQTRAAATAGA
jgi:hypothetical protein